MTVTWNRSDEILPPENVNVRVFHAGQESVMYRVGKLWFFFGSGVYAYYTPEYWREEPTP